MLGDGQGERPWVYVAAQKGRFNRVHRNSAPFLIAIYLVAPWISLSSGRLIFADLPGRRLHLFGQVFTALDTRFMMVFLLVLAFGILFVTAMLGRIWCGYLCPQTVFLEAWIRPIERLIEGSRGKRRKVDKGPWTVSKATKKLIKWLIFLIISAVLSLTFLSYFVDSASSLWTLQASSGTYGVLAAFTLVSYLDLAWFREQFCNYVCPYARFQGALCDAHTLTIGYDTNRGEPRRKKGRRKSTDPAIAPPGDCVNCGLCVSVCPQGIDIRDGFQLECITCGHCIDACTQVLGRSGKKTLIAYTTEATLAGRPKRARKRPWIYATVIVGLSIAMVVLLAGRSLIDATVNHAPGQPYSIMNDGRVQNGYRAHLLNNDLSSREFELSVEGPPGLEVVTPYRIVDVDGGSERTVPIFLLAEPDAMSSRTTQINFVIRSGDQEIRREGTFQTGAGR